MPMKTSTVVNDVISKRKSPTENSDLKLAHLRRSVRIPMLLKKKGLESQIKEEEAAAVVDILPVEKHSQNMRRSIRHIVKNSLTTENDRQQMREKHNAKYSAHTSEEDGSIEGSDEEKSGGVGCHVRESIPNYRKVSEECGRNIDLLSSDDEDDREDNSEHGDDRHDNHNDDRDSAEESDDDLTALYKQQSAKEIGVFQKESADEKKSSGKNEKDDEESVASKNKNKKRNLSERKRYCNSHESDLNFTMKKSTKTIYNAYPYENSSEDKECSRALHPHTGYRCSKQLGYYSETNIDDGLNLWDRW